MDESIFALTKEAAEASVLKTSVIRQASASGSTMEYVEAWILDLAKIWALISSAVGRALQNLTSTIWDGGLALFSSDRRSKSDERSETFLFGTINPISGFESASAAAIAPAPANCNSTFSQLGLPFSGEKAWDDGNDGILRKVWQYDGMMRVCQIKTNWKFN